MSDTFSDLMAEMAEAGAPMKAILIAIRAIEDIRAAREERLKVGRAKSAARRMLLPKDWETVRLTIFKRDGYQCVYCGTLEGPFHCDHVVPLAEGGDNSPENLATACEFCNLSKGARLVEEWMRA